MANDIDVLIKSLKRQRTDLEAEMTGPKRAAAAGEIVDRLQKLRKRSEDVDETWRQIKSRNSR
jgi:hypothetical protein